MYDSVTDYVRTQFNRAEKLLDDKRKGTIGFAPDRFAATAGFFPEAPSTIARRGERLGKSGCKKLNSVGAPA
ncbi:MAG: hypothetical protein IPG51_19175 [Chloroflexi bacterium]|nr:hypothetical protein [Chloroflexota bacterium]